MHLAQKNKEFEIGQSAKHIPTDRICEIVAKTIMLDPNIPPERRMIRVQFPGNNFTSFIFISELEHLQEKSDA